MNYDQSIVENLLKSTLESERLKLLSELKLVHFADRLFHIFTTRQAKNCFLLYDNGLNCDFCY